MTAITQGCSVQKLTRAVLIQYLSGTALKAPSLWLMARQCATTIQRGVRVYCGTMTFDWYPECPCLKHGDSCTHEMVFSQWMGMMTVMKANLLHDRVCRSQASSVVDDNVATKILEKFRDANGILVDTARIYGMIWVVHHHLSCNRAQIFIRAIHAGAEQTHTKKSSKHWYSSPIPWPIP